MHTPALVLMSPGDYTGPIRKLSGLLIVRNTCHHVDARNGESRRSYGSYIAVIRKKHALSLNIEVRFESAFRILERKYSINF